MNKVYLVGVVFEEPKKYEKNNGIHARTILKVKSNAGRINYLPITLRGARADVFCSKVHKGSVVSIEGELETNVYTTSKLRRAIEIQVFAIDFALLKKKQLVESEENELEYVVRLYDPERYVK